LSFLLPICGNNHKAILRRPAAATICLCGAIGALARLVGSGGSEFTQVIPI